MCTSYTYLVGWSTLDRWYYGCQYGKNANPDNLWVTYFTSSKVVKDCRLKYGEPDVIKIRKVFSDCNKCREWESRVLKRLRAAGRLNWLNKQSGSGVYINTTVNVRCAVTGIYIGPVPIDHPLYVAGSYIPFNRGAKYGPSKRRGRPNVSSIGRAVVRDSTGSYYQVPVDDIRITSGELQPMWKSTVSIRNIETGEIRQHNRCDELPEGFCHLAKGRINVKDKDGNSFQVLKTDERLVTGELVHVNTGRKVKDPSKASRPKEKNGRWTGISDDQYLDKIRAVVTANPEFRWKQIAESIDLPASRTYLRKVIEQEFDIPTYNNRKLTNSR
jgi:hypothetical protein